MLLAYAALYQVLNIRLHPYYSKFRTDKLTTSFLMESNPCLPPGHPCWHRDQEGTPTTHSYYILKIVKKITSRDMVCTRVHATIFDVSTNFHLHNHTSLPRPPITKKCKHVFIIQSFHYTRTRHTGSCCPAACEQIPRSQGQYDTCRSTAQRDARDENKPTEQETSSLSQNRRETGRPPPKTISLDIQV